MNGLYFVVISFCVFSVGRAEIPEKCLPQQNSNVGMRSILTDKEAEWCHAQMWNHYRQKGDSQEREYLEQTEAKQRKGPGESSSGKDDLAERAPQSLQETPQTLEAEQVDEIPEKCLPPKNSQVGLKTTLSNEELEWCRTRTWSHYRQMGYRHEQKYLRQAEAADRKWYEEAAAREAALGSPSP